MSVSIRRLVGLSGWSVGTACCLALGVSEGSSQVTLLAGIAAGAVPAGAVPAVGLFALLVAISGLLLAREVLTNADPEHRRLDGPPIAAIVPVYEDATVLPTCVESLLASDYANLEVAIVTEPGDAETAAVATELAAHPDVRVLTNRRPGSKARAINGAIDRLDVDYFAAIDADERVDTDFVPRAMHALVDADRDAFQARPVPRASGPIETLAYCERLLFHASYKLVEPFGFTYCRSASAAFTGDAVAAVGGFDDVVTEDIDFAHACFRQGLDVRQERNVTNETEAPHTLRDFWRQRKRWRLGHIEVLRKGLTGGFAPSGLRGVGSTLRLAASLSASVCMLALLGMAVVLVDRGSLAVAASPLLAVGITVAPVCYRDYRRGHVPDLSPTVLLAPLLYPLFGLVTIRAAFEYVCSWDGEWYRVEKTGA